MQPNIIIQRKGDPSKIIDRLNPPFVDLTADPQLTLCLIEPRVSGQDPIVLIISSYGDAGSMAIQMSLMEFVQAANKLTGEAVTRWRWQAPSGGLTPGAKRQFADHIRAELDKWLAEDA